MEGKSVFVFGLLIRKKKKKFLRKIGGIFQVLSSEIDCIFKGRKIVETFVSSDLGSDFILTTCLKKFIEIRFESLVVK